MIIIFNEPFFFLYQWRLGKDESKEVKARNGGSWVVQFCQLNLNSLGWEISYPTQPSLITCVESNQTQPKLVSLGKIWLVGCVYMLYAL